MAIDPATFVAVTSEIASAAGNPAVQADVQRAEVAARSVVTWVAGLKGLALVAVVGVAVYAVVHLVL